MIVQTPAKVNLCLRVLSRRADGYHDIDSIFYQVSLFDTLRFEPSDRLDFHCSGEEAGPDKDNLVLRAARMLRERTGTGKGAHLILEKRIPSGAGLGGGSSDAAAALCGLNHLWGLGLSREELVMFAAELGSDIPFFLSGPAARVRGRGELIEPIVPERSFPLLLVKPECRVSTAWAYRSLSLTKGGGNYRLACSAEGVSSLEGLRAGLWNDFEEPVFREFPEIRGIKERLLRTGAAGAVMSGSGSCVVGLFERIEEARAATLAFPDLWRVAIRTLMPSDVAG